LRPQRGSPSPFNFVPPRNPRYNLWPARSNLVVAAFTPMSCRRQVRFPSHFFGAIIPFFCLALFYGLSANNLLPHYLFLSPFVFVSPLECQLPLFVRGHTLRSSPYAFFALCPPAIFYACVHLVSPPFRSMRVLRLRHGPCWIFSVHEIFFFPMLFLDTRSPSLSCSPWFPQRVPVGTFPVPLPFRLGWHLRWSFGYTWAFFFSFFFQVPSTASPGPAFDYVLGGFYFFKVFPFSFIPIFSPCLKFSVSNGLFSVFPTSPLTLFLFFGFCVFLLVGDDSRPKVGFFSHLANHDGDTPHIFLFQVRCVCVRLVPCGDRCIPFSPLMSFPSPPIPPIRRTASSPQTVLCHFPPHIRFFSCFCLISICPGDGFYLGLEDLFFFFSPKHPPPPSLSLVFKSLPRSLFVCLAPALS